MCATKNPADLQQGSDPADLFGFKINYNTVDGNVNAANKLYNGNIAETFWSTATDGGFVRNYGYKYDQLNRLKDATYQKSNVVTNMYNENLTYDKNGNIMTLKRNGDRDVQTGTIGIDNLSYGYATNSNKLMSVVDNTNNTSGFNDFNKSGNDYAYDVNGNMTLDKNKKITAITYNHLNLPTKIVFTTGNIVYIYNAAGQKVQKVVTTTTPASVVTTDYLGGYQYKNTVLQYFPTAEGYVKNTPVSGTNTYSYVFNYTDHLGNTRLSYTKNPSTNALTILEESNYYPFGLKHNGYNPISPIPENRRLFNGKELQEELGLNQYDYGARNYDASIGRWISVDPLAETSRRFSPYTYALNNPVYFIDPDGMQADDWVRNGDSWEYRSDITSKKQASDAGYSDYSDGKTNNTYKDGNNTVTLKEGGKWSNSSNNIEKAAADKANPTEIAAAKVDRASVAEQGEAVTTTSIDTEKVRNVADGVGMGATAKEAVMSLGDAKEFTPTASKMLKATQVIGSAAGVVSAVSSVMEAYGNPTTGNLIKAGVNTALVFARINPFVTLTVGIMDATGISDKIYEGVGNTVDNTTLKF